MGGYNTIRILPHGEFKANLLLLIVRISAYCTDVPDGKLTFPLEGTVNWSMIPTVTQQGRKGLSFKMGILYPKATANTQLTNKRSGRYDKNMSAFRSKIQWSA